MFFLLHRFLHQRPKTNSFLAERSRYVGKQSSVEFCKPQALWKDGKRALHKQPRTSGNNLKPLYLTEIDRMERWLAESNDSRALFDEVIAAL